ncbi:hypothetical protein DID88_006038 [Monilinia fructigena]|uniref:Mitotic apparatus protein p62 n=1 Tax=Monilinia fructigena TaxID=38457 RepID=A0A395J6R4_9HELO|nr:hypothetical protein DID88_006038 [Monilinia fructigena]
MTANQFATVLRITSSTANQDEVFLMHVESIGSRPLDVKLIGTDGELVFAVSLNHTKVSSIKSRNSPCSDEEWIRILSSILLHEPLKDGEENVTRGVEIRAKVEKKAMTILVQKVIEGIKQRLGAIRLDETEEEESASLNGYREQQETLDKLNKDFKESSKLKSENENRLLEKFGILLNEKKLKIRNQQKLLAGATVDPKKIEAMQATRARKPRTVGASRSGKRKVGKEAQAESSDDSDDASSRSTTPERSDDETASESEEDAPPPAPRLPVRKNMIDDNSDGEMQPAPRLTEATKIADLPPKRQLPFAQKAASVHAPKPTNDRSETESGSNDEL